MPWLLLHLAAAAVLTWLTRRYALGRGLLDTPGARRSHTQPTPRGGGIAIVLVVLAACAWGALHSSDHGAAISLFAAGLVLVAGIGWLDDHRPLPASRRFVVHLLAASSLASALWLEALPWWQVALGWGLAVCLINIWNFMDGINGLAASQAAIAAAGFSLLLPAPWSWVGWALCAGCLGFLPFNFPRARIFMGDVGSGALGYLLASLTALSLKAAVSPFVLLLPLVVFCIDAGFTLLRRVLRGEAWWQPHTTHAYQCAARRLGHTWVTMACALFSLTATILMLIARQGTVLLGFSMLILSCSFAAWTWMWIQRRARTLPQG
ncbi:glycosyltransferase family 4 protein [Pseudoxanthomonas sp. GM95]|uniref:MraY family glycosyltransferase n=1 Tax=Pseudoxanthomonas sp. GM95 TaxID=1881043 RepID=UPI0020C8A06C|nr:glycosyltransferase family 4 protein [Pseudoxanthomonas sp. GM95]